MDSMKQQWQILSDKFEALSSREQWMMAIAGWVAILFLGFTLIVEPLQIEKADQQRQKSNLQSQLGGLYSDIAQLTKKLKQDPNAELDKEYQSLLQSSQDLALRLADRVDTLVTPSAMAQLLEQVLKESHQLKLISLTSLPSEPIMLNDASDTAHYYLHPIKLVLTGRYFDIENYLLQLESMPVKYYWRSFRYQVEEYPQARMILEVYTIGVKEDFIGG